MVKYISNVSISAVDVASVFSFLVSYDDTLVCDHDRILVVDVQSAEANLKQYAITDFLMSYLRAKFTSHQRFMFTLLFVIEFVLLYRKP